MLFWLLVMLLGPGYVMCRGVYDVIFGPMNGPQCFDVVVAFSLIAVGAIGFLHGILSQH